MERIAAIAKKQFEKFQLKRVKKVKETLEDESDGSFVDDDAPMLQEVIGKEEIKAENSDFLAIDIKKEPTDLDDVVGHTWEYEYLDEAIVKFEDIIDETSHLNPVVLVKRLDVDEIQRWTRVKEEKSESTALRFMFSNDDLEEKKPRKVYNAGKPRKLHSGEKPKKIPALRFRRKLRPGEVYTCDMCGKTYNNFISISAHCTQVHKAIGDLPCEHCHRLFKSSGNLQRHILTIHHNLRPHICHVCAKAFNSNSKLMNHLKTHEEPEECKICGKLARNMKEHVKRHNQTDNRIFLACPTCGKLYDKNVLAVHIHRVHGKSFNGNIFRCDDCDINYTRREDWRQ